MSMPMDGVADVTAATMAPRNPTFHDYSIVAFIPQ
jgi:hypothetical protein